MAISGSANTAVPISDMIDRHRVVVEQRLGDVPALADRERGQRSAAGDVADGVDRGHVGPRDTCRPRSSRPACSVDAGRLEAEALAYWRGGRWRTSRRRTAHRRRREKCDDDVLAALLERRGRWSRKCGVMPRVLEPGIEARAQILVEAAQHAGAAIDDAWCGRRARQRSSRTRPRHSRRHRSGSSAAAPSRWNASFEVNPELAAGNVGHDADGRRWRRGCICR